MTKYLSILGDRVSNPLKTRPLAVFSVISFIFIIMRLYFRMQPLFVVSGIIVFFLIMLNIWGKINKFIMIFISISMFLGMFSTDYRIERHEKIFKTFDGQFARVEGTISSIPQLKKVGCSFYLDVENALNFKGEKEENLKIFVVYTGHMELNFGDKITFNGNLKQVAESASQYGMHYLAKGASLTANNVTLINISEPKFPKNIVSNVRNYIISVGDKHFISDEKMLFKALVAGDKSDFSDKLTNNLSASGLSHIAAVSGLHVSILGLAIFNLLRKKHKLTAAIASAIVVYLFTLVTGAAPSTVRAAIMFSCFILAKITLQENDSFTALSFSAMILAIVNPYVIYDWGFILSFLSVLGIQIFSQYFKNLLRFLPEFLADSISVTLSAQITTIPALAKMFGELPVYSVFANIIVSVIFLFALYLCIILVLVSKIGGISYLIAACCAFSLKIIAATAHFFATLPNSTVLIDGFTIFEYICFYGIIIMFAFRKKISINIFVLAAVLCSVYLIFSICQPHEEIKEYNVGAESVIMISEDAKVLLSEDNLTEVNDNLEEWGWYSGIDSVVLKSSEENQIDSLVKLKNSVGIKNLFLNEEAQNSNVDIVARKMGINVYYYPADNVNNLYEFAKELAE